MFYVTIYLLAIIAANLIITHLGPSAAIPVAFIFIGLDLTARDHLHDAWQRRGLARKMAALIAAGSLLSWLLNRDAGSIALASFAAFASAALVDTVIYHLLRDKARLLKINGSNILAASVDSLVFPTIAFGAFMPVIVLGQFAAKVGGGFVWSLLLQRMMAVREEQK